MTTQMTPSKPVGPPRGRSAVLIVAIAIAAAFVAIAVVRWQGSSDGTAAPAPAPITLPRVTTASALNGEDVLPRGGLPEGVSEQQTGGGPTNVPAPAPDCMTVAYPITC